MGRNAIDVAAIAMSLSSGGSRIALRSEGIRVNVDHLLTTMFAACV